ncbi:hypothetical protein SAMN04489729_1323 [Amycolatopsis lurida]|nr:hypothetical protein SAMN04489729_1323 [Amycolatopsis lurida]
MRTTSVEPRGEGRAGYAPAVRNWRLDPLVRPGSVAVSWRRCWVAEGLMPPLGVAGCRQRAASDHVAWPTHPAAIRGRRRFAATGQGHLERRRFAAMGRRRCEATFPLLLGVADDHAAWQPAPAAICDPSPFSGNDPRPVPGATRPHTSPNPARRRFGATDRRRYEATFTSPPMNVALSPSAALVAVSRQRPTLAMPADDTRYRPLYGAIREIAGRPKACSRTTDPRPRLPNGEHHARKCARSGATAC